MIAKCPCDHCGENIEFSSEEFLSGSSVVCPHCGKETLLYVSHQAKPAPKPPAPASQPPQRFTAPTRSKIPIIVWIVAGVFILCALCLASFFIGKNSRNSSDQTSEAKPKSNLSQFLQNIKANSVANKKTDWPSPPTSGMEFSTKLLENFQERVIDKKGWIDGEFGGINNDSIGGDNLLDTRSSVGFIIYDKNRDMFLNCYASKAQWGDFLLNLRDEDRIRIIGQAEMRYQTGSDSGSIFLRADSIEVIK